jgi:hypothetical protein
MTINNAPGSKIAAHVSGDVARFTGYRIDCECERNDLVSHAWKFTFLRPEGNGDYAFDSFDRLLIERRTCHVQQRLKRHIATVLKVDPSAIFFRRSRRRMSLSRLPT